MHKLVGFHLGCLLLLLLPEDEVLLKDLAELVALVMQHALVNLEVLREDRVAIAGTVQSSKRSDHVFHILHALINRVKLFEYARHQSLNLRGFRHYHFVHQRL